MHFSRDSCISSVLESSWLPYTLRFSVRGFLTLTRKLLFLEVPLLALLYCLVLNQMLLSNNAMAASQAEGELSLQTRLFNQDPQSTLQENNAQSFAFAFNLSGALGEQLDAELDFFYRYDSADDERTKGDIRKLYLRWLNPHIEVLVGFNRVFWGVTEVNHLVDIVAQTDTVESPDGETKLGQAMIAFTVPFENGLADIYLLPYFRERTFPGENGRLRFSLPVDYDNPVYEDPDEDQHIDFAARIAKSFENTELALSYFQGTGRDSSYLFGVNSASILPYYPQIKQLGLEAQYIWDEWLFKLEFIHRDGQPNLFFEEEEYQAVTTGFEYTYYGLAGSASDLGIIAELLYDSRGQRALSPYEEDIALGGRWVLNNLHSAELIFLWIQDLNRFARVFAFEGSIEMGESFALSFESTIISHQPQPSVLTPLQSDRLLYDLRDDDSIEFTLSYYF